MTKTIKLLGCVALAYMMLTAASCKKKNEVIVTSNDIVTPVGPQFNPDSAYAYCAVQCEFGPRIMNSDAHEKCGKWIAEKFKQMGCDVELQNAALTGYDGTMYNATNIIARSNPDATRRILLCAHWDSRPWADNDPDSANWRKPVMAANDGASGVAVMLEVARLLSLNDSLNLGVDFVCFDAEDCGVPQWEDNSTEDTWCLGSKYWANNYQPKGSKPMFGILLDMVGGQGASFYQESISMKYASDVVGRVWNAAEAVGYSSYFVREQAGFVTDDHVYVNQTGLKTIDIISHYPNCKASSFGPTWHTVNDDMQHIDTNTLKAVGQTIIQVLFSSANE